MALSLGAALVPAADFGISATEVETVMSSTTFLTPSTPLVILTARSFVAGLSTGPESDTTLFFVVTVICEALMLRSVSSLDLTFVVIPRSDWAQDAVKSVMAIPQRAARHSLRMSEPPFFALLARRHPSGRACQIASQ